MAATWALGDWAIRPWPLETEKNKKKIRDMQLLRYFTSFIVVILKMLARRFVQTNTDNG
jgi:hypothetical protein